MHLKDLNQFNSDFLDGKHASNSAGNVPVLDENAKLPFDQIPTGTVAKTVSEGNHKHDDIYYTEEEMDEILTTSETNINTNMNSAISDSKTEVLGNVSNNYVTAKDYNDFKSNVSSQISQTETNMDTKISNVSKTVDSLNEQLKNFKGALGNNIQTSGGSINIGSSNSSTDINVNDNGMSFVNNNQEVASIYDRQMSITNVTVENSLTLGSFKFLPRNTGDTSLIWDDHGNMISYITSYANKTNPDYPCHQAAFDIKPVAGELYTIELCASLGSTASYWGVYNSGGDVSPTVFDYWEFHNGVAKKSFFWIDTMTYDGTNWITVDNTSLHLYPMPYVDGRANSTVTYVKMYKGDSLWKDNGNYLRFNNIYDNRKGYQMISNKDDYSVETNMYCYLEEGVEYVFKCDVDAYKGGSVNWGSTVGEDTVRVYMQNRNPDWNQNIEIASNPGTFTVPSSGRWWLKLNLNKNGCEHWFSNMWITKAEGVE